LKSEPYVFYFEIQKNTDIKLLFANYPLFISLIIFIVSEAIMNSSSVGITATFTLDAAELMSASLPRASALAFSSTSIPR